MLTRLLFFPLRRAAPLLGTNARAPLRNSHNDVEFPQKTLKADHFDTAEAYMDLSVSETARIIRQALGAVLGYVVDSMGRDLIYLRGMGSSSGRGRGRTSTSFPRCLRCGGGHSSRRNCGLPRLEGFQGIVGVASRSPRADPLEAGCLLDGSTATSREA
jgi:hypothetical protein